MTAAARRILLASVALLLLLVGLVGVVSVPDPVREASATERARAPEILRFSDEQRQVAVFLDSGRAAAGGGRGLFETDFFKPPPAPPAKPKPTAPTTRELVLFYRGLAAFPDGARVAYLAVEGRTVTLGEGELVADGWKLASFDDAQAVLAKDERTVTLAFNRRATLSVPVKP